MKKFPPRTAGACMIKEVPVVKLGETVGKVREMISKKVKSFETIDYIFVVDEENVLKGVISIKELFEVRKKNKLIEDVMKKNVVYVHPFTHQERVVYLALSHGIKMLPVVDKERHFLGVVPYDTILQIFNQETREDIFKFGGIFHRVGQEFNTITDSTKKMVRRRIPWLLVGIVGGTIAASIVSFFEAMLSKYLVLAAFIPVLVYMSDAVGTQSETLIVRGFALDPKLSIKKWLKREFFIPSEIIDRFERKIWIEKNHKNCIQRAKEIVEKILKENKPKKLEKEKEKALDEIINNSFKKYGF